MTAPSVLYIASASASDPLIVSQVIRYLERMRPSLTSCHLITFERDHTQDTSHISAELLSAGINWHPIHAWSRLRSLGFWFDRHRALALARRIVLRETINIVHCRSFLAGLLGRKLKSDNVRFLYDMRGLWSLEKRDKGTIRNSQMFKVAWRLEQKLFRDADHIVSLTRQGKNYLTRSGVDAQIDVIPTCVDLQRYLPNDNATGRQVANSQALKLVSAGTLGAGYLADEMFRFGAGLKAQWPELSMRILTGSNHVLVKDSANRAGLPLDCLNVSHVAPDEVPAELAQADVGLCFVKPTKAKVASCPTKLAEYLACGIPVIATDGVGDVTEILEKNRVGVIVRHDEESSWPEATQKIKALLMDTGLKSRCRAVAEAEFGVNDGASNYLRIYEQLVGNTSANQREAA